MESYNSYEQKKSDYAILEPFLNREEVLWMGRPTGSSRRTGASVYLGVFSIFWLGFAIFWTVTATASGGAFGLFGLPFLAIGCVLVYTVFWGQKKTVSNTYYAVTPRRALIVTVRRNGANCTEHIFAKLPGVTLTEVNGTRGTISFVPYQPSMSRGYYRRGVSLDELSGDWTTAFRAIDDVQRVYRIVSDQIAASEKNDYKN